MKGKENDIFEIAFLITDAHKILVLLFIFIKYDSFP